MQEPSDSQPPGRKFGTVMIALAWVALLALVTVLMQSWLDRRYNPNTQPDVRTTGSGAQQVVLQRNSYGHYVTDGAINGKSATFMLDTGATDVVVPQILADEYGLDYGYPVRVNTANGTVTVHTTVIDRVTLGPFTLNKVRANINPHMDGDEVLLGMSFLKHLDLSQSRGQLIISNPHTSNNEQY